MAIVVGGLIKRFGDLTVLDGFSHVFEENTVTCLMGPSGCGKTTLLHILLGLLPPDEGRIDGLQGKRKSAVFQEDRLCENLSPISNVRLVCPSETCRADISRALAEVGLADFLRQPARTLSGGMKRRVALARAMLAEFDVLFLDEPFKGLDWQTRELAADFVLRRAKGKTVIMVTHDPKEPALMGAQTVFLHPNG